jgi:methylated-DNA-[protein]-cysteine S-methyltransferase
MDRSMSSQTIQTPIGSLTVFADQNSIKELRFVDADQSNPNKLTEMAVSQLQEYFDGQRKNFDLPLAAEGTEFQKAVWKEISKLEFGEITSYGQIAKNIGKPKAARAVGGAVGANPLAIIVPCHRVMATSGAITGYSGGQGISTKLQLLKLENIE